MTMYAVVDHAAALPCAAELVTAGARCWRAARDCGAPVQPHLHALLGQHDCGMLAPVFDSLMTLYEAALGREIVVGAGAELSGDERVLIDLIQKERPRSGCLDCTEDASHALDCAICSTRIMIALTLGTPTAWAPQ